MYIQDESADAVVAKDEKLQSVVQGSAIMLWLPGQGAGVSANMCLMFGWMGTMISVYRMVPQLRYMMQWYALGSVVVMSVMGILYYTLLRGHHAARSRMYAYATFTLIAGAVVAAVALVRADWIAAALAAAGIAFTAVAQRLVAGPDYALLAAFFRAKRAYADERIARR